jgi:uncharacterized caspase-like protein
VTLVSDFGEHAPKDATKDKIRTVFDILAGRHVPRERKQNIPDSGKLRKASPDDAVFISFSSHGYADERGNFYLLPADVRRSNPGQRLPDIDSMISSDELSLWLRDVDAADMVMIIDACYAAASVSGSGFKPAPMGNRGLGQLAYDKQMRILTATREKDQAIEVQKGINQGLLTHALVHDGLEKGLADFKPKADGKLFVTEWLEFAVIRVPKLFEQIKKGKPDELAGKSSDLGTKKTDFLQRPKLFDLRKNKNHDIQLLR